MVDAVSSNATATDRDIRSQAQKARAASRLIQSLDVSIRQNILRKFAESLNNRSIREQILQQNKLDTDAVQNDNKMSTSMKARLVLNDKKLSTCADGMVQLSQSPDPIGRIIRRTQLANNVELQQITVPLGVLLIIFEARPEVLPQLVALAIESGNGLLLKGGKETTHSLNILYKLACDAIDSGSNGQIKGNELVVLLSGRSEVDELLKCDDVIDERNQQQVEYEFQLHKAKLECDELKSELYKYRKLQEPDIIE